MNCNDAKWQLEEYRDGGLDDAAQQAMDAHLTNCESCQSLLTGQLGLRERLRALPVLPATVGFTDRAMRYAVDHHLERRHRAAFYKGFSSALAAGVLLWLVVGVIPTAERTAPEQIISIALQDTHELKLAFHTVRALNDATISIQLPDNVQLVGFEERRVLEWQANFTEGDNVLRLPIRALRAESGQLIAQVKHAEQNKTITIRLDVTQAGLTTHIVSLLTVV